MILLTKYNYDYGCILMFIFWTLLSTYFRGSY